MIKVSRSLKEASYKIKREKEHYEKLYNREPTLKEIATTLDMDESDILMAMDPVRMYVHFIRLFTRMKEMKFI